MKAIPITALFLDKRLDCAQPQVLDANPLYARLDEPEIVIRLSYKRKEEQQMKKFGLAALGIVAANRCPRESWITSRTCPFRINCLRRVPLLQKERIPHS